MLFMRAGGTDPYSRRSGNLPQVSSRVETHHDTWLEDADAERVKMPVAVKRERARRRAGRAVVKWMWALFPHVVLILSLIAYAVFGALLFRQIEGRPRNDTKEYGDFVRQVVELARNDASMNTESSFIHSLIHALTAPGSFFFYQVVSRLCHQVM